MSAVRKAQVDPRASILTRYFHPWEFDPDQPRLPLRPLSSWRTYVGIGRARERLTLLLGSLRFLRAVDLVPQLMASRTQLPRFDLVAQPRAPTTTARRRSHSKPGEC